GLVEQIVRLLGVTGLVATEQQPAVVVLRVSEPWSSADALAQRESIFEVPNRIVVAIGRRCQEPEIARDWAKADLRVADRDSVGVVQQAPGQRGGAVAVAEPRGRLGEKAEADHPLLVERKYAKAACRERVKLGASLGSRPQLAQHVRQNAAPDRIGRIVRDDPAHKPLDLVDSSLLAPKAAALE